MSEQHKPKFIEPWKRQAIQIVGSGDDGWTPDPNGEIYLRTLQEIALQLAPVNDSSLSEKALAQIAIKRAKAFLEETNKAVRALEEEIREAEQKERQWADEQQRKQQEEQEKQQNQEQPPYEIPF
jgi:thiamine pyrophosphate-dependent acetolactate synthase large subunit-like protein